MGDVGALVGPTRANAFTLGATAPVRLGRWHSVFLWGLASEVPPPGRDRSPVSTRCVHNTGMIPVGVAIGCLVVAVVLHLSLLLRHCNCLIRRVCICRIHCCQPPKDVGMLAQVQTRFVSRSSLGHATWNDSPVFRACEAIGDTQLTCARRHRLHLHSLSRTPANPLPMQQELILGVRREFASSTNVRSLRISCHMAMVTRVRLA